MEFDVNIVKSSPDFKQVFKVTYYVYEDTSKDVIAVPQKDLEDRKVLRYDAICFWTLPQVLANDKKLNRVWYKPVIKDESILSKEDVAKWIKMAVNAKLLPDNVKPEHFETGFVIKADIPLTLLYVYLVTIRQIEEEPDMVRSVIYLVDKGVDMCGAIGVCCRLVQLSQIHNYFTATKNVYAPVPININNSKSLLSPIIGLKRFISEPDKHQIPNLTAWRGQQNIEQISKVTSTIKASDLLHPQIIKAINSKTDEEANAAFAEFSKTSS